MAERDEFVEDKKSQGETHGRTILPNQDRISEQLDAINSRYEIDFKFRPGDTSDPFKCKTVHEMVECLERNPDVKLDARVLHVPRGTGSKPIVKRMKRESFIETFKTNEKRFREDYAFDQDFFDGQTGPNQGLVGSDWIPILGGPFNKQLYLYDMLDQTQQAFWAYNHDPIAHRIIQLIVDFTMGKGFRVDFDDPMHDAIWAAFWKANDMENQVRFFAKELSMYGESIWWALPNKMTKIAFPGSGVRNDRDWPVKTGIIPRIRVMDPSQFWDYITQPEDITDILAWQWVTPTQWQLYTGVTNGPDAGKNVKGSSFIYQQIPADQIIHTKVNCVSNEKRGRSDLFPILGYLKRLRDTVNYSIIAMQKTSAWSMDTTIEGSMSDLQNYLMDQQNIGVIPPAGSEFIHTNKIKREYLSNSATSHGGEPSAFIWCLNMIAAGCGIPISYLGTHLSGGQTRASAVVGTEPVAKLFENRQQTMEQTIRKLVHIVMQANNIDEYDCKFTWPEIVTQDRSQKLKDLYLAETAGWFSPKRSGTMASKEFGQDDYDWENERSDIDAEQAEEAPTPLTSPPASAQPPTPPQQPGANNKPGLPGTSGNGPSKPIAKPSAVTGTEKRQIKSNSYS